jgi:hypothetical protein
VAVENAIVESELLHIRILSEFFLGRGRQDDDVSFEELVPTAGRPRELLDVIDELEIRYSKRSDPGSPCWELNKLLAHLTLHRGNRYDYSKLLRSMEPILHKVTSQLSRVSGRPKLMEYVRNGESLFGSAA